MTRPDPSTEPPSPAWRTANSAVRLAAESAAELASAVAAGCVAVALLWARQERLVWQPPRFGRADPDPPPEGARRLAYQASDGQPLLAWVVDPPYAPDAPAANPTPLLIAFHGNAELAAWGVPWARAVAARTGWRVVLPEYRGYAGLGGAPSHDASRRDARAALAAARADAARADADQADAARIATVRAEPPRTDDPTPHLARPPRPVALLGHSLGSAVAAELAEEEQQAGRAPAALLLQAPFTSIRDMARLVQGARLERWWEHIARVHFDTRRRVAGLDLPVAVAHGGLDLVIPVRMGRQVHAAARRPGRFLDVPTAGHNDLVRTGGARYWAWLAATLDEARGSVPRAGAGVAPPGAPAPEAPEAPAPGTERDVRSIPAVPASQPPSTPMRPLATPDDVDALLRAPLALLYKHSDRCPVASAAWEEVAALVERRPEAAVWVVDVIGRRALSRELAERLGVVHQSPQAIVLVHGRAVWDASHFGVRVEALERQLDAAGELEAVEGVEQRRA